MNIAARFFLNQIAIAFCGKTIDQLDCNKDLAEVNRLIELRLSQYGFVFESRKQMGEAINRSPNLQQLINTDPYLKKLLILNRELGQKVYE